MNTAAIRKYPIGIQSFEKLRSEGFLYIDKTDLVYQLAASGVSYFLSRPRRFGKSLLLSTLKAYFEGKKELFEGLAIEKLEKEWTPHPVLHLDLNAEKYTSKEALDKQLESQLIRWEQIYGAQEGEWSNSIRFMNVIRAAFRKTGQRTVILIDEYDKPLLETFHNNELQEVFRDTLVSFYSVLKSSDEFLEFVFITGVTKFAQMSIFSTLNHLEDISLAASYETLCGMTRKEIETNFAPELEAIGTQNEITYEEVMSRMTDMYDGYRFCEYQHEGIYNPFSVLNAIKQTKFGYYWFATGTPTFLVKMLQKTDFDVRQLVNGIEVTAASLTTYRVDEQDFVPMIYQSGYLTIREYDEEILLYKLGFPNNEVKYGLLSFMTPYYTPVLERDVQFNIARFKRELATGDVDAFMNRLRAFFGGIPYELSDNTERHYQAVFYIVLTLLGQFTEVEVRSSRGRADAVVKTAGTIFVFEFKLNGTAEEALRQIDEKGYLIPYSMDGRKLVKVGAEFDKATRNIERWLVG